MEQKDGSSASPRSRYVWDPNKLAWVETEEEPAVEEVPDEVPVEIPEEEGSAAIAEEVSPVEAVAEAEGLEYRGVLIRVVAIIIDLVVLFIVNAILASAFGTETTVGETEDTVRLLPQWLMLFMGFAYFVGFWVWRGQTPGKMAVGAKVVKSDGSPIGLGRSILRYVVYGVYGTAISYTIGNVYVAAAIVLFTIAIIALSRKKRGLHDLIAGTCVINTRSRVLIDYATEQEPDEAEEEPDGSEQT